MHGPSERALLGAGAAAALTALGWSAACTAQEAGSAAVGQAAGTMVYECPDGAEFVVRIQDDVAWVFAASQTLSLPRVRAASGARFEKGGSSYWSKGEEAMIDTGGETHHGCRNNPRRAVWEHAKLNGVDFRATGNEPGWVLEISERTKIRYVGDYGRQIVELTSAPPQVNAGGREARYEARDDEHYLRVLIEGQSCNDTMSGEAFPARVTVTVDGRTVTGCGRELH